MLYFGRHHVGNFQCLRSRTLGVGENVQLRKVEFWKKLECLFEKLVGLASCSYNYVYSYECVRYYRMYGWNFSCKKFCVVFAFHQFQHSVASALQRNVKVRHKTARGRAEWYYLVGKQVRLYWRNPVSFDVGNFVEWFQQILECLACSSSEVAYVDACNNNFFASSRGYFLSLLY